MVNGYCDEKFSEAREVFSKSISTGFELGAAISLEIEGEMVLDLWGGVDNPSTGTESVSYTHLTLPTICSV